ncbi:MAG: 50S ribosomal protein L21 [Pseudomonadota bacterium]
MFAIITTGGKQYRVQDGDVIDVERLRGEVGETVDLTDVLMVGDKTPKIGEAAKKAKVSCEIIAQRRASKILVFKKKRRKKYRRTYGHRQAHTRLKVLAIKAA